jgi:hypothetical protein
MILEEDDIIALVKLSEGWWLIFPDYNCELSDSNAKELIPKLVKIHDRLYLNKRYE